MYLAIRKSRRAEGQKGRRADASNRDAGCEELEEQIRVSGMRDAGCEEREEQIRVNEMRDTKSGKSRSESER
ncbi:hypothetical protein BCU08_05230 [Vibrio splendidus]|nr:hypothetical protein BCU08_05230 [Vibrio splendidus]